MGFTNLQQAIIMALVFILPSFITWISSPDPMLSEISLRFLAASILSGVLVALKEIKGGAPS